jgi:hypothetical protein
MKVPAQIATSGHHLRIACVSSRSGYPHDERRAGMGTVGTLPGAERVETAPVIRTVKQASPVPRMTFPAAQPRTAASGQRRQS